MSPDDWIAARQAEVDTLDAAQAHALVSEVDGRLASAKSDQLLLLRSNLRNRLQALGVDRRKNGLAALADCRAATEHDDEAAVKMWARLVAGMASRGRIMRFVIETATSLDLAAESERCTAQLARLEHDALAQLLRLELARFIDDRAAVRAAESALGALPPAEVAIARGTRVADAAKAARATPR